MSTRHRSPLVRVAIRAAVLASLALIAAVAVITGAVLPVVPVPAAAADVGVTNAADDGAGSLRQAIADANASPGADVVTIAPGVGTITLASPITITDDVTIVGNGATITRSTSATMLQITLAAAGSVSLRTLTFTADVSTSGGTVVADPTAPVALEIRDSRFTGMWSTGPSAVSVPVGSVTVADCVFERVRSVHRGGAIWVGTAIDVSVITDTLFHANYAGSGLESAAAGRGGGAIAVDTVAADASVLITRSYFRENVAAVERWEPPTRGFAVHVGEILGVFVVDSSTFDHQRPLWPDSVPVMPTGWSIGAEAVRDGGVMRIVNSTFDEDVVGDPSFLEFYVVSLGAVDAGARFSLEHSTVVGGGTLRIDSNAGSSLVRSTIAEGLTAPDAILVLAGAPVSVEWSVVSSPHVATSAIDGPGNQWSVPDMMLAPLADNGGPTPTMMIGPTGPAVGTGMPTALPTEPTLEQRSTGFLRRLGPPDIGAVELPGDLPTLPDPTPTPTPTPTPSPSFDPPTLPEPPNPEPAGLAQTGSTPPAAWVISAGVIGVLGGIALLVARRRRPTS